MAYLSGDTAAHVVSTAFAVKEFIVEFNQTSEQQQLCLAPSWDGIPSLQTFGGKVGEGQSRGKVAREVQSSTKGPPSNELSSSSSSSNSSDTTSNGTQKM